jgi:hypothetical protein
MFKQDWGIKNPINLQAWKVLREAEQSKKDTGSISDPLRSSMQSMLLAFNPQTDREALERTSTNAIFSALQDQYTARAGDDIGDIKDSTKRLLTYLGGVEPATLGTAYRELKKVCKKAGVEVPEIPDGAIKESLESLVALGEITEKAEKGREVKEGDLPEGLKPEKLAKQLTEIAIEASYTTSEMAKSEDFKNSLERVNKMLMKKKKPIEIVQQYGRKLREMSIEKIAKNTSGIKGVMKSFEDKFKELNDFNSIYTVRDGLGELYQGLGQKELLERDYTPVTTGTLEG